ncbi:hypothetical protein FSP39_023565 [Pinctada imbricata]|uniref:Uncharacterized protein n=1 Tax=Pinctada imbricata TaxID=66713 RepID=A0AA88XIH4_PINIB|nr:hypothetical protein FSP39_023565 [Pinctada imbricata]
MDDTALIEKIGKKRYRRRLERERYHTTAIDYNTINAAMTSAANSPATSTTSSSATSTTSGGNKLAQEINDEFLTCKICLEVYKNPKCLDCLHTFCEACIDNHVMSECTYKKYSDYREFTCPLCRKRTQLPLGGVKKLPDNFLVSSLSEVVQRQRPSKFPFCDICKLINRKHREASSKCLDCNKLLCKQCVEVHKETKVTKNHSVFDVEIEKDIECKEHSEEVVRFYCEPCETCICVLCTFNEHKDHEISQFSDAVIKYKETIQNLLDSCKGKIEVYDVQLSALSKCEGVIKAAEQRVRDTAIQFIADIRTKEKQFIEDLHEIYGSDLMDYVSKRSDMQVNVDSLKSTCSLTELVLRGKDIELLLLKKQVQEKLSCLADIEMRELPNTVGKNITFAPGVLDLGSLEDLDTPQGRLRTQRSLSGLGGNKISDPPKFMRTFSTQTEGNGGKTSSDASSQTDRKEYDEKSFNTDNAMTIDKAVNTRSRSLQSVSGMQTGTRTSSTDAGQNNNENGEPGSPTSARRHRRRRERGKVEVSSRPTTNNPSQGVVILNSNTTTYPVLSYSSSIDDN